MNKREKSIVECVYLLWGTAGLLTAAVFAVGVML